MFVDVELCGEVDTRGHVNLGVGTRSFRGCWGFETTLDSGSAARQHKCLRACPGGEGEDTDVGRLLQAKRPSTAFSVAQSLSHSIPLRASHPRTQASLHGTSASHPKP
jgi:hypothetical protein